jgi:heme/copper-type cytochrome/quinol oxidase subunit 2
MPRLTDAIFWFSAICCAVAQAAILRSVIVAPARAGEPNNSSPVRRAADIVWAVLPGLALIAVFVFTWRVMHGVHAPILSASTIR